MTHSLVLNASFFGSGRKDGSVSAVEFLRLDLGGVYHLCTRAQISHPEFEMFECV